MHGPFSMWKKNVEELNTCHWQSPRSSRYKIIAMGSLYNPSQWAESWEISKYKRYAAWIDVNREHIFFTHQQKEKNKKPGKLICIWFNFTKTCPVNCQSLVIKRHHEQFAVYFFDTHV